MVDDFTGKERVLMKHKIGFAMGEMEQKYTKGPEYDKIVNESRTLAPRKSLVRVHIPDRGMTLTYYNLYTAKH